MKLSFWSWVTPFSLVRNLNFKKSFDSGKVFIGQYSSDGLFYLVSRVKCKYGSLKFKEFLILRQFVLGHYVGEFLFIILFLFFFGAYIYKVCCVGGRDKSILLVCVGNHTVSHSIPQDREEFSFEHKLMDIDNLRKHGHKTVKTENK